MLLAASGCSPKTPPATSPASRAGGAPAAIAALRHDVDAILADPTLARGYWGVVAKSLKSGDTLYEVNAHKLLLPASNMKIVTLAAAAAKLGWDYTYATTIRAAGSIDAGVLHGDLVVAGTGDPSFTAADGMADRVFADWAARLKAAGIRTIAGRIVADGATLGDDPFGAGWMWDDLVGYDSAGIGALQLNEDAVRLIVEPGPSIGASAAVSLTPYPAALTLDNSVTTSAATADPSVELRRLPGEARLHVSGTIPLGHGPIAIGVSVRDPVEFFLDSLRAALVRNGLDVTQSSDGSRPTHVPATGLEPRLLVEYRSPPLSTLALRLMKISQNQYAETVFRTIGGTRGSLAVLQPWGVSARDLIQRDGSGLSRYDLVTPEALVTILTHVWDDPRLKDPFIASLPLAGDVGLTNRMKGTAAEGNARAKTGSMTAVRALSGYVTSADGESLVFSIVANNFDAEPATINRATDAIVVRLAGFRRQPQERAP